MGGSFDFASATNSRGDWNVQDSILGRNIFPSDPSSPLIHGHCSDNYRSINYILPKGVDAEQIQPIADGGFEQGPDQCCDDVAFASKQTGPTNDDRADRQQLVSITAGGLHRSKPRRFNHRADAAEQTG